MGSLVEEGVNVAVPISVCNVDDLKETYKELGFINLRQEKRVQNLESRGYQIAISYFLFQGIVLIAVSHNSTATTCQNSLLPLLISLTAALLHGCAFTSTVIKWARTKWQYDLNQLERETIGRRIRAAARNPSACVVDRDGKQLKPDPFRWFWHYLNVAMTMVVFLIFTVIMILACRFLCNDYYAQGQGNPDQI